MPYTHHSTPSSDSLLRWLSSWHISQTWSFYQDELGFLQAAEIKANNRTRTLRYRFLLHCRMAGWFRSWDTSGICRLEPPYHRYFGDSGRYQPATNLFEKITICEPEVASWLGLISDEEIKSSAMKETPQSHSLLHALKRKVRMGCQASSSSGQLCTQWIHHLGKVDGSVYWPRSIRVCSP